MRELRYVGPGEDNVVILESVDGAKQFRLPIDEKLMAALRERPPDEPLGEQPTSGKDAMTELRPRDIQTRVRAGEDPQTLADEAGTSLERVMRFAHAVLQERLRIVDEARRGKARAGSEGHTSEFGALIDHRVGVLGTEPTAVSWDSFRRPDGGWTVTANFTAQTHSAEPMPLVAKFSFALSNRTVTALNDVAADLLTGNPIAALQKPVAPQDQLLTEDPADELIDSSTDIDAEPARLAAVPDPQPQPAAAQTHEHRSSIRFPSRRQKAHTHPIPVSVEDDIADVLFDQEAADPAGTSWHEPPLPLDLGPAAQHAGMQQQDDVIGIEASVSEQQNKRTGRSADKPRMPSWDDILLGVRRKSES
jgi:hypothetical protein